MGQRVAPCVASDTEARHCVAALLFGARCCEDASCVACSALRRRMRSRGYDRATVTRSLRRARRGLAVVCPICGFAPPPCSDELLLPRLERAEREFSGSWVCRVCGKPLPA